MSDSQASCSPNPLQGVFLLLPVLNEAENIGALLDRVQVVLRDRPFTIGILDDGSTDGTLPYLEKRMRDEVPGRIVLIRRQKTSPGCQRGSALLELLHWGLQHTSHELFVEMDADLSHRPEEIMEGLGHLTGLGFDIAIASKYLSGSTETMRHPGRRLVSAAATSLARCLLTRSISDFSNGFRFYNRTAARLIASHQIRYASPIYLAEVLMLWLREGMRVAEFPSVYVGRQQGSSKVIYGDVVKGGLALLEIAIRYHITGYRLKSSDGWTPQRSR